MYLHTKIGNGMYVSEASNNRHYKQHIIENSSGYIVRITREKGVNVYRLNAVLVTETDFSYVQTLVIPTGNYKALRAALKAFVSIASMYRIRKHVY